MSDFYRVIDEVGNEDEYLNVIGMMVTDIRRKQRFGFSYEISFHIIQDEWNGWTKVSYITESHEQELKFQKLLNPVGTIIFLNRCYKENDGLVLDFDKEMAAVALRPNTFQVEKFLKVSTLLKY